MPASVLKNGHDPSVRESFERCRFDVAVLRTIGHHDDQLGGVDLNGMFPAVQRATLEYSGSHIATGGVHASDDAISCHPGPAISGYLSIRLFERDRRMSENDTVHTTGDEVAHLRKLSAS